MFSDIGNLLLIKLTKPSNTHLQQKRNISITWFAYTRTHRVNTADDTDSTIYGTGYSFFLNIFYLYGWQKHSICMKLYTTQWT